MQSLADTRSISDPYAKAAYANVVLTLIIQRRSILETNKAFANWVITEWSTLLSLESVNDVHPSTYYFSDLITNCLLILCLLPSTNVDEIFNLVLGLNSPGTALSKVTIQESIRSINKRFDAEPKHKVIDRFYNICIDGSISADNKLLIVSCFINPMLSYCIKENEVVIDAELGDLLLTNVVGKNNLSEASQGYLELGGLVVGLLYKLKEIPIGILDDFSEKAMGVLISRNLPDPNIQIWRYLLISRLCHKKQPKSIKKILILKILFSLLKVGTVEDKVIIDEALDNLLPITFYWMKKDKDLKNNFFAHLETLLKGDIQQRNRIFRLLLKYPNLFYIRHEMFTKHIISLSRSRIQQDSKRLVFDLASLFVAWEKIRMRPSSYTEPIEIGNNEAKDKGLFKSVIKMLKNEPERDESWSESNGNSFLHYIVKLYVASFMQHQQLARQPQQGRQQQQQQQQQVHDIGSSPYSNEFEVVSNILKDFVLLFPPKLFSSTFYPKGIEVL